MSKKPDQPKFNVTQWMNDHPKFVIWWKEHRASGYAQNKEGLSQWGIEPWRAYDTECYRAEYLGWSPVYSQEEIEEMRTEQRKTEALTFALEKRFGPEFWKRMTPLEFIQATKQVVHEMTGWSDKKMEAEINKAYETEPGQSEEETELLQRRRE